MNCCCATALAIKYKSIYSLLWVFPTWFARSDCWCFISCSVLCGDFVFVIVFPQLLLVLYFDKANTYGSLASFVVGLCLRLLCNEALLCHVTQFDSLFYTQVESPVSSWIRSSALARLQVPLQMRTAAFLPETYLSEPLLCWFHWLPTWRSAGYRTIFLWLGKSTFRGTFWSATEHGNNVLSSLNWGNIVSNLTIIAAQRQELYLSPRHATSLKSIMKWWLSRCSVIYFFCK